MSSYFKLSVSVGVDEQARINGEIFLYSIKHIDTMRDILLQYTENGKDKFALLLARTLLDNIEQQVRTIKRYDTTK